MRLIGQPPSSSRSKEEKALLRQKQFKEKNRSASDERARKAGKRERKAELSSCNKVCSGDCLLRYRWNNLLDNKFVPKNFQELKRFFGKRERTYWIWINWETYLRLKRLLRCYKAFVASQWYKGCKAISLRRENVGAL